jgi:purine-nucleoside/S-methyl-5'-thioadenosine phosphorylase / adenosine deaminase
MIESISIGESSDGLFRYAGFQDGGRRANGAGIALSLRIAGDAVLDSQRDPEARCAVLRRLGIDSRRMASVWQVHSKSVVTVPRRIGGMEHEEFAERPLAQADGMITGDPHRVLGVTVADCLPIFLYDRTNGARALVHSGWRGTGIAIVALEAMTKAFGTRAADVAAFIGPGIGPCCYDVPQERADLFLREYGARSVRERNGKVFLDLLSTNVDLLGRTGVTTIVRAENCTSCTPWLGSFRREGPDRYTHMLALFGDFPLR